MPRRNNRIPYQEIRFSGIDGNSVVDFDYIELFDPWPQFEPRQRARPHDDYDSPEKDCD